MSSAAAPFLLRLPFLYPLAGAIADGARYHDAMRLNPGHLAIVFALFVLPALAAALQPASEDVVRSDG